MPVSAALNTVRFIVLTILLVLIWLVVAMVLLDRFLPPFDRLVLYLLPWKGLDLIPFDVTLGERLRIMEQILTASNRVANYAFFSMIGSFVAFGAYLTFVYQHRQSKVQENRLLMLKNREIARRNEFIRYISATIGHEFKNNLGRIKRRIDLLHDLPPDAVERIDENLTKLFADIDIFKKISDEREAALIDFRRTDLRGMLRTLAVQYSDMAEVAFDNGWDTVPPLIIASETLLKTVFENLMDNAVKYRKPGQKKAKIHITCDVDHDATRRYVSLSFRDEGIGMDEQQADRCFYKSKSAGGGWGEGLYFAKYVVGLHAGKIRVGKDYTRPDGGTEIIISLPYVEEPADV